MDLSAIYNNIQTKTKKLELDPCINVELALGTDRRQTGNKV